MKKTFFYPLLVLISLLFPQITFSSQLHLIPLEEDAKNINTVLIVEVTDVSRESTYMKLKNGQDGPMTSTRIIISGKVKKVLWGKCPLETIKTEYTWIVPVKYDEDGKALLTASLIRSGSGLENEAVTGKEYIFSYKDIYFSNPIQTHQRMDNLEDEKNILAALKKKR